MVLTNQNLGQGYSGGNNRGGGGGAGDILDSSNLDKLDLLFFSYLSRLSLRSFQLGLVATATTQGAKPIVETQLEVIFRCF